MMMMMMMMMMTMVTNTKQCRTTGLIQRELWTAKNPSSFSQSRQSGLSIQTAGILFLIIIIKNKKHTHRTMKK